LPFLATSIMVWLLHVTCNYYSGYDSQLIERRKARACYVFQMPGMVSHSWYFYWDILTWISFPFPPSTSAALTVSTSHMKSHASGTNIDPVGKDVCTTCQLSPGLRLQDYPFFCAKVSSPRKYHKVPNNLFLQLGHGGSVVHMGIGEAVLRRFTSMRLRGTKGRTFFGYEVLWAERLNKEKHLSCQTS
jgi:hypothetical protein